MLPVARVHHSRDNHGEPFWRRLLRFQPNWLFSPPYAVFRRRFPDGPMVDHAKSRSADRVVSSVRRNYGMTKPLLRCSVATCRPDTSKPASRVACWREGLRRAGPGQDAAAVTGRPPPGPFSNTSPTLISNPGGKLAMPGIP